jgi:hypothetical protein
MVLAPCCFPSVCPVICAWHMTMDNTAVTMTATGAPAVSVGREHCKRPDTVSADFASCVWRLCGLGATWVGKEAWFQAVYPSVHTTACEMFIATCRASAIRHAVFIVLAGWSRKSPSHPEGGCAACRRGVTQERGEACLTRSATLHAPP